MRFDKAAAGLYTEIVESHGNCASNDAAANAALIEAAIRSDRSS